MKLPNLFLPYQRRWIADTAEVKICEKSRRTGMTWTEAADDVITAATAGRDGQDVWYVGYNQDMAREYIEDAAAWARRFKRAAEKIEQEIIRDEDEQRDILTYRIRFASGHKIVALSSRPSNLRGKQGIAVIDEAAFHDKLGELLKAALAFLIWGGKVRVISTHNGENNPFNELVNDVRAGRAPYALHRTTFDDAMREGLFRAICRERGDTWSVEAEVEFRDKIFAQYRNNAEEELECVPNPSTGAYLPSVLIESVMRDEVPVIRWERNYAFLDSDEHRRMRDAEDFCVERLAPVLDSLDQHLMTCVGEDFGRSGDLTVIWPLQFQPNMIRRTPFVLELRNIPFNQQRQILFYVLDRLPRLIAGAMDARGNGQYLAEQAVIRFGQRIAPVMLSLDWYRDNMPRYKAAFEDGTLELPRDTEIFNDHRELVMEKGVAKIPDRRSRDATGAQRHGDSAIAGALAYYASTLNPQIIDFRAAPLKKLFVESPGGSEWRDRPAHDDDGHITTRARAKARSWFS
jgi:phage FluMu gp28-like protein